MKALNRLIINQGLYQSSAIDSLCGTLHLRRLGKLLAKLVELTAVEVDCHPQQRKGQHFENDRVGRTRLPHPMSLWLRKSAFVFSHRLPRSPLKSAPLYGQLVRPIIPFTITMQRVWFGMFLRFARDQTYIYIFFILVCFTCYTL